MGHFTIHYQGQLRSEATHNASGTTILTDAPVDNHGRGEAFSPTDLVCTALATCIITTIGIWAQKEQLNFEGTRLEVKKTMQATPRKIAMIEIEIHVSNKQLNAEQKAKIENIAHNCPVALSLHPDVKQQITFVY